MTEDKFISVDFRHWWTVCWTTDSTI